MFPWGVSLDEVLRSIVPELNICWSLPKSDGITRSVVRVERPLPPITSDTLCHTTLAFQPVIWSIGTGHFASRLRNCLVLRQMDQLPVRRIKIHTDLKGIWLRLAAAIVMRFLLGFCEIVIRTIVIRSLKKWKSVASSVGYKLDCLLDGSFGGRSLDCCFSFCVCTSR